MNKPINSRALRCLGVLLATLLTSVTQRALHGDEALDIELRAMVTDHVLPLVDKRGGGAIAIGGFTAATSVKGSAGPEIQLKLSSILKELNLDVNADDYRFELTGNYLPYNDSESGLYGVKLISRMIDAEDGTTLGEFPRFVFGAETVPRMLGLNVMTKGSSDPKIQSVSFQRAMQSPETFIQGSEVAASPASSYSMEILILQQNKYQPRPFVPNSQNRPFVDIAKNEVYAIRLLNHSQHDAAVRLTIDGVNVFQFSEQEQRPNHWIVPAAKDSVPGATIVYGWDKTMGTALQFKVVDFPDSAAARIKFHPSQDIGLITASFAACWEHERDRPRSEGRTRATGFGNEIVDSKTLVKRHVGAVREVISVRYERPANDQEPIAMQSR